MHGHRNREEMYGPNQSTSDKSFHQLYFATTATVPVEDTNECSMTNHFCETARAMHKGIEDDSNDLGYLSRI